jgi:hypothetical protein
MNCVCELIFWEGGPTGGKQRAVDTGPRKCYKLVRKDKKDENIKS